MDDFKVSVIIPVYNAASFVSQAVESAVYLSEVGEIILVEDGSPDNALEICKKLESKYDKVKLIQHPNGENRGAGASRNLGIKKSTCDYIAFLDADDKYKSNRFLAAKAIFLSNDHVDGIYDAVEYFDDDGLIPESIYTINRKIPSNDLFYYLLRGTFGHFHTNAITLKKNIFNESINFSNDLRLHQDSFLWLKLSYHNKLVSGNTFESVALVRRHINNRIKNTNKESKKKYYNNLIFYFILKKMRLREKCYLIYKVLKFYIK